MALEQNGRCWRFCWVMGLTAAGGTTVLAKNMSLTSSKDFPDATFREYVKQFDTNNDGSLSDAERTRSPRSN